MSESNNPPASAVVICPKCTNKTRVPESLFGQPVRCPECKTIYRAPVKDAEGNLGLAELLPEPPPQKPVKFTNSPLLIPGLLLLLLAMTSLILDCAGYYIFEIKKDQTVQNFKEVFKNPENEARKNAEKFVGRKIEPEDITETNIKPIANHVTYAFPIGCLMLVGSLAILTRKFYPLAVLGSIAAICNFGCLMCLFSAPVGIFSLVKLFDPDSKKLFS
ncbi:hypothetical protein KIH39_13425 [Telmatocola sphagniphila]|uniref:Zinc finger/thioredoxin putative domain-containing protein n=1 Tax=Telmatocola sphagniphila TaxID=1123043 RepID=A0A8E6B2I2_9BACT|nr:hypothetical protein [Telmatocola sphagniphila]QVL29871.1 hypothetical protein KIH39_13425 [Telmatocola sphagniphila]